jgi:hypothetical protein
VTGDVKMKRKGGGGKGDFSTRAGSFGHKEKLLQNFPGARAPVQERRYYYVQKRGY